MAKGKSARDRLESLKQGASDRLPESLRPKPKKKSVVGKALKTAGGLVVAAAAGVAAVAGTQKLTARAGAGAPAAGGGGREYHVLPRADGWAVEGADGRLASRHGTKKEAVAAGRRLAREQEPSRLVIHGGDGKVQTSHDYGD